MVQKTDNSRLDPIRGSDSKGREVSYRGDYAALYRYSGSLTVHSDPQRGFDYHPGIQHRGWYATQILMLEFKMRQGK
jgi:hypothetical protein